MLRRATLLVALLFVGVACTVPVRFSRQTYGPRSSVVLPPSPGTSPLTAELRYEAPILRGLLRARGDCRLGQRRPVTREYYQRREPHAGLSVAALVVGAALGVGSVALLSSADEMSNQKTCSEPHAIKCNSPREDTVLLGTLGVLGSAGLMGGSLWGLADHQHSQLLRSEPEPDEIVETTKTVVCDPSSLGERLVSATLGTQLVGTTVTHADGSFTLVIPAELQGTLVVILSEEVGAVSGMRLGEVSVSPDISRHSSTRHPPVAPPRRTHDDSPSLGAAFGEMERLERSREGVAR